MNNALDWRTKYRVFVYNFKLHSFGIDFRMDSKWFQMQGLDLILETSK